MEELEYLTGKRCDRCNSSVTEEYYTLQITAGEPLRDVIAEEDCQLCLNCRIEFHQWLEAKRAGASITNNQV